MAVRAEDKIARPKKSRLVAIKCSIAPIQKTERCGPNIDGSWTNAVGSVDCRQAREGGLLELIVCREASADAAHI